MGSNIIRLKLMFKYLSIIGSIIGFISSILVVVFEGDIGGGLCVFILFCGPCLTLLIYYKNVCIEWDEKGFTCSNFFGVKQSTYLWSNVESYILYDYKLQLKVDGGKIIEVDVCWQDATAFIEQVLSRCIMAND